MPWHPDPTGQAPVEARARQAAEPMREPSPRGDGTGLRPKAGYTVEGTSITLYRTETSPEMTT